MIEHWLMNITIDFKHHSNNPQQKAPITESPTILFSKKNNETPAPPKEWHLCNWPRRVTRRSFGCCCRTWLAMAKRCAGRWRDVRGMAAARGWCRGRQFLALEMWLIWSWPWKNGDWIVKNADGIMKNWDFTMKNGDKSQSNIAISSSKIAIESDRKLRLNLWIEDHGWTSRICGWQVG